MTCERLLYTDLEKEEIQVVLSSMDEVVNRGKNCLLIKLLSNRYYNREVFKATMKKVWKSIKTIRFYVMGAGLMMAKFEDQSNKKGCLEKAHEISINVSY